MVLDRDFLIKIKTASTDLLLRMLYYGDLTEEQKEAIIEELKNRGYSAEEYERLKRQKEEEELNEFLGKVIPAEDYPDFVEWLASELEDLFYRGNIPYRIGLKESYDFYGFNNLVDYLALLNYVKKRLDETHMGTQEIYERIDSLMNSIKNFIKRIERRELSDEFFD